MGPLTDMPERFKIISSVVLGSFGFSPKSNLKKNVDEEQGRGEGTISDFYKNFNGLSEGKGGFCKA